MKYTFTPEQKEHMLQWATWLNTTTKPQIQGALHNGKGFCCLGLWIDEYYNHPKWKTDNGYIEKREYCFPICSNTDYANYNNVYALLEEDNQLLGIYQDNLFSLFQSLNDNMGYSFKEIAREIKSLVMKGSFTTKTQKRFANK